MIPSLLILAKIGFFLPFVGIGCVALAIYGTIYANKWKVKPQYKAFVSYLGTTHGDNKYSDIFSTGFTITAICIIIWFVIKTYLLKLLWKLSCLSVSILVASILGAIGIVLVAQCPWNSDDGYGSDVGRINGINTNHAAGATFGIFFIVLAQFLDALNWVKYMQYTQINQAYGRIIHLYDFLCPILAMTFFLIFIITYMDEADDATITIQSEWMCLLCVCIGFLTQPIHFVLMHSHLKQQLNQEQSRNNVELGVETMENEEDPSMVLTAASPATSA